jgi:anti-sigma factor RsiW
MSNQSVEALSCQELVELVTAYLERALSAEQSSGFEQHIAGCDGCDVYVEQMRTTIRLAGKLTPEAVPPEAERALLSAFRSWAGT